MDDNGKKIVLIAEDTESNYKYLEVIIKDMDAKPLWAKNGKEAVALFEKNEVDLVLMDMKMPEMDGIDATKAIKKINKKVPIIAQTAYAQTYDVKKAKKAGCDDYIFKPISMKMLNEKLEKYM